MTKISSVQDTPNRTENSYGLDWKPPVLIFLKDMIIMMIFDMKNL